MILNDVLIKNEYTAFKCSHVDEMEEIIDLAISEGIVFTKSKEYLCKVHTTRFTNSYWVIIHKIEERIAFYSREHLRYDEYDDWSEMNQLNWTAIRREEKINEIINE